MHTATPSSAPAADAIELAPGAIAAAFGLKAVDDAYGTSAVAAGALGAGWRDGFVAPLPDLGLITVQGEEAAKFLHGQLTNDVEHLPDAQARWYGYCTAKGRMLAAFLGWRDQDAIRLVTARPQLEPARKRLSMFVLRAKAKLVDASAGFAVVGVGGAQAPAALTGLGLGAPEPMQCASADGVTAIGLPAVVIDAAELRRWIVVVPAADLDKIAAALAAKLAPVGSAQWRWTEVLAGIARIVPATSELFVPQMLNYELVGGVSFTKGCYPGQEVVARSHYLGKLKRRMFLGHVAGEPPAPADDVSDASGGEPCGQVVMAAPAPGGGADLLFECRSEAAQKGGLQVAGAPLTLAPLPYPFPA